MLFLRIGANPDAFSTDLLDSGQSLSLITAVDELEAGRLRANFDVRVVPGPTALRSRILVSVEAEESVQLTIFDVSGRAVLRRDLIIDHREISLDLGSFSSGVYTAVVRGIDPGWKARTTFTVVR